MGTQSYETIRGSSQLAYIQDAQGTGKSALAGGDLLGTWVNRVIASSTAAQDHDVVVEIYATSIYAQVCCVTIPAGAGQSVAVPAVDVLDALPGDVKAWYIDYNTSMFVYPLVALGQGEEIRFATQCAWL